MRLYAPGIVAVGPHRGERPAAHSLCGGMEMTGIRLLEKHGGKSGGWVAPAAP